MKAAETNYPGEKADASRLRQLAENYHEAADFLLGNKQRKAPMSRAPWRLLAIHAIELYLNAFLLSKGHRSSNIRGLQHGLSEKAELAVALGLNLRKKTKEHLSTLTRTREYVVARYDPDGLTALSEMNRLSRTMEELAEKVVLTAKKF